MSESATAEASTRPEFYTVKEVAEIFKVSEKTVYRWIELKQIKSVTIGGTVRIPASAVLEVQE